MTWLAPGLGHIRFGRPWLGGAVAAVYFASVVLVLARAIPVYVWVLPALVAEISAQRSIWRLAGIEWRDLVGDSAAAPAYRRSGCLDPEAQ